jgi:hypothetical protein
MPAIGNREHEHAAVAHRATACSTYNATVYHSGVHMR